MLCNHSLGDATIQEQKTVIDEGITELIYTRSASPQTGEYRRQYGTDTREIRDEPGRLGATPNGRTDGGEEEDRLSSIQDVTPVRKGSMPRKHNHILPIIYVS